MRIISISLLLTCLFTITCSAALLPIVNPGFELPWVPEDDTDGIDSGVIQGWAESQDGRQGLVYHFGAGIPDPPEGYQSAYLKSYWTPRASNGIWQTLDVTFKAQTYILSVKARSYTKGGGQDNNLNVRLYAGVNDNVVLEENQAWSGVTEEFEELRYEVTLEPNSPFIGQPIGIHFNHNKSHGNSWVLIDDVQLETEVAEASLPSPVNHTILDAISTNLLWQSGDFHTKTLLAIDDNFDDVNEGQAAYQLEPTEPNVAIGVANGPYPDGLVPGRRYYWQVTEVNESHPDSPWPSAIWSFFVPPRTAWDSQPSDGFNIADPNGSLKWSVGLNGQSHTVYFGTDRDVVANATEGGIDVGADTSYYPGLLEKNTAYFWRIDTVDGTTTHKGTVWSFETLGDIAVSDPNLLVWYTFNEGEGNRTVDFSGHKNDGIFKGDTAWIREGVEGNAIALDGDRDWVELPQVLDTADFSLTAWIKTDQPQTDMAGTGYHGGALIWSAKSHGGGADDFSLAVNGTKLNFGLGNENGNRYGVGSQSDVVTAEWVHIAALRDVVNETASVFVNGNLDNAQPYTNVNPLNAHDIITIGANLFSNYFYNGLVDEVRIYNKVLTAADVKTLSRINPNKAYDPTPAAGSTHDFGALTQLSWTAGNNAMEHDVYFSNDRDAVVNADVNDANGIYLGRQTEVALDVPAKAWGQTYFWRIDEVAADGSVSRGSIWTYSILNFTVIEGFELYASEGEENRVWMTWSDAYGNVDGVLGLGGSILEHAEIPLMEENRVHEGNKAMPFYYDNDGTFYNIENQLVTGQYFSKVQRRFDTPLDLTQHGDQAMSALGLWMRGVTSNAPEDETIPLDLVSILLTDADNNTLVVNSTNPNLITSQTYSEIRIEITQVIEAGLNPKEITKIEFAVGDLSNQTAGLEGLILVDDMRLYADTSPANEE